METLKKVAKVAFDQWTELGRAFLGPCGGQNDEPKEKLTIDIIDHNTPKKNTIEITPKSRRETFLGL